MTCGIRRGAFALAALLVGCADEPATYDTIIRGGTVFDGSESPGIVADVGIVGGWVHHVGDLSDATGATEVDASGQYVAPGFINLHSHDRLGGVATAANLLAQGVTTILLNADGGGPLDIDAQLTGTASGGLAVNIGAHIGFNRAWAEVNGPSEVPPTPEGMAAMHDIVREGLDAGAWGVSGGLDYKPAYFAATEEVVGVLSGLEEYRTLFTNHDRLTPETNYSSFVGMLETVEIGEATGLMPVITHMKIQGREQGSAAEVFAMIEEAASRGVYAAADAYPYLAGQTSLAALIIPGWAQSGGVDAMLSRFENPPQRARIVIEANEALDARFGGPGGVYLPETQRELTDVMSAMQVGSGAEAVIRLLQEDPGTRAILRFGAEEDLAAILSYEGTSISCDCDPVVGSGGHPRYYGSYPRALGRYVRDLGVLTWEGAIHRMTGLPAETVGMVDRGYLAPGMAADVVVFDPDVVIDHATYIDPTAASEGVRHVWVNGIRALAEGEVVAAVGGEVLRRRPYMPARAPARASERQLIFSATLPVDGQDVLVSVDVGQAMGAPRADGVLRAEGTAGDVRLEVGSFGHLQTAPDWASLSATVSTGDGSAVLVLVADFGYPGLAEDEAFVVVRLDGREVGQAVVSRDAFAVGG
ncbi:MAG: amidohydrolase family protein [Gemmatimonadota bacterium]